MIVSQAFIGFMINRFDVTIHNWFILIFPPFFVIITSKLRSSLQVALSTIVTASKKL